MGQCFVTYIKKQGIMQKNDLRNTCIVGAKCNTHTSQIFINLRILKHEYIYIYKTHVAKFILSYLRNELPVTILTLYHQANDSNPYNGLLYTI